ncbi:MAG: 16S rRNA (guanine(527)-N(7))-methyltransferase RsmG [Campylobacteraceae bacterium]|mgnify:CR=1 FL=1|jgi:16S rRNA (guanine527-N7)-methyltransferase|nr:16S rRNA (guanine(527)-N(7))-methyltransferase RsmG [Campylobacteraceae bacterium]MBT3882021.1 16S rRNA (guanine(527)-N(7))-methyltransferase RsmG [Campylobacteraceae bacterium]MBT4029977.1 16S rRNA (guanine(527)-N(7))-methyltransferase RsmG [Campylobacteraceae bacterium]MBT4179937.1 16S rRNA (guanine(527)-N(7))-methyltransferase RsmG [Campylobacteraceae bacterium]MBT4572241.1 16S rRNA (guanine(527)-N(7))-methyltransferase RsmG [Campylobacteraceae bacterium]
MLDLQLKNLDLELNDEFLSRCEKFIELLQKWGKVHSFTTRLTNEDIEENIIDSIYPLKFLDNFESFADIGTGAGYPGMLLAIARPDIKCYLIEPRLKRVAFLNFVKNALGLKNVTVIQDRVENCKDIKVDLVTSRAVTNTQLLIELTKNIVSSNTKYLFYKGSLCQDELDDLDKNKYEIISTTETRNYLYIKDL